MVRVPGCVRCDLNSGKKQVFGGCYSNISGCIAKCAECLQTGQPCVLGALLSLLPLPPPLPPLAHAGSEEKESVKEEDSSSKTDRWF